MGGADADRIGVLLEELKVKSVGFPRCAGQGSIYGGSVEPVIDELNGIRDELGKLLERSAATCSRNVLETCAALPEIDYWVDLYVDSTECPRYDGSISFEAVRKVAAAALVGLP